MHHRSWPRGLTLTALCWVMTACGQKGPPLAPLHLVPAGVSDPAVRRIGDRVRLRFVLPSRNENGPGPLALDRVEIYAMTVGPGGEPSAQEVLSREHQVGQIAVRPVLEEGQVPAADEQRPEPGTPVTFDEELTAAKVKPEPVKNPVKTAVPPGVPGGAAGPAGAPSPPAAAVPASAAPPPAAPATSPTPTAPAPTPAPAAPAPATPTPPAAAPAPAGAPAGAVSAPPGQPPGAAAAAAAAARPARTYVRRIYIARGVTKGGRPGTASAAMEVPLVDLPVPPQDVKGRVTEQAVVLEWTGAAVPTGYNVYRGDEVMQPLNSAPLTAPSFEHAGAVFGEEQCYRVRAIAVVDGVSLEGEPSSPPHCLTPRDTFPPAAPKGLAVVPTPGQVSLIWDANTEKDLAGYLVLRGDAPDGPLKAITAAPIRETLYRDATVTPGVRYVYAIVAVDSATPQNLSAQSARVEETAR